MDSPLARLVVAIPLALIVAAGVIVAYRSYRPDDDGIRLVIRNVGLVAVTLAGLTIALSLASWVTGLVVPPLYQILFLYVASIPMVVFLWRRGRPKP